MSAGSAVSTGERDRLPGGWRWARLGEVCELVGEPVSPAQFPDEDFAHYSVPSYDSGNGPTIEPGLAVQSSKVLFPPGVVLFCKLNPRINRVWHVADTFRQKRICSTEFMPLIPRPDILDPSFLAWALRDPGFADQLRSQARAATKSRERLKPQVVMRAVIPLPPLPAQQRIVAILNEQMKSVERARAAAEQQLEAAKALPAAYLREVFESPEASRWPRKALGSIASVTGGIQKSPLRTPTAFHRPYITVRNVQQGYLDLSHIERFEVTPAELDHYRLLSGDILVVEGNGSADQIGRTALFGGEIDDCVHQNHVIRARPVTGECDSRFVSYFLNSAHGRGQMLVKAITSTGLYSLSVSKVKSLLVPAPPVESQRELVESVDARLATARGLAEGLETQTHEVEVLPAALLRRAFRGEL
jgi:type I restriction enzyme S subunit